MCAADRPLPLLVVADAGARLVRRGLVAPGDAARWHGARVAVFRRGPVVCELPAVRVDAPSRAPYLPRVSQHASAQLVCHPGTSRIALRLRPAHGLPRATESVPAMIVLVRRLLDRGVAYQGDDGSVYFAIDRFPGYGRLSGLDRREIKVGARVASDEYAKEDPRDFALWKKAGPDDDAVGAAWDAPFGRGRPGWHLECSAMSLYEIGTRFGVEPLDIHAGGVDLIFPPPD